MHPEVVKEKHRGGMKRVGVVLLGGGADINMDADT